MNTRAMILTHGCQETEQHGKKYLIYHQEKITDQEQNKKIILLCK